MSGIRPAPPLFSHDAGRPLGAWLFCVVALNLVLCTSNAFDGDIDFWINWIGQLQARGFTGLEANYPPVYMHWLWLCAKFHAAWQQVPEKGLLLRSLVTLPVALAHIGLLLLADRCLRRAQVDDACWNATIALLALNPAILMNGPIWGQVDLIYSLLIALLLYALIEGRYLILAAPLLVVALLTKFQAICIAPVLLPLLWQRRRNRRLWWGLLPAILIAALLMLPYILAGSLRSMIDQTYLQAASLYPYATFNGNNLWQLLDLNTRSDSLYLLDRALPAEGWRALFTPKRLGIALFGLWSLYLCVSGWRGREQPAVQWRNAFLSALGFFALLPGMHERYLFPAVIIALIATTRFPEHRRAALWLTILCFGNMAFMLHPSGGALPYLFAALTLGFGLHAAITAGERELPWRAFAARIPLRAWGLAGLAVYLGTIAWQVHLAQPDADGWIDATRLNGRSSHQGWGQLGLGVSVQGNLLKVAGKHHGRGFGTHADSLITLPVPPRATSFSAMAGLDDEASGGMVEFSVSLDGRQVWQSGSMVSGEAAKQLLLDVRGARQLELRVNALGSDHNDHADWLAPRFRIAD